MGVFENRLAVNTGSPILKEGALTHLNIFTIQQCREEITKIHMRVIKKLFQKLASIVSFYSPFYLSVSKEKRLTFVCAKLNKHSYWEGTPSQSNIWFNWFGNPVLPVR